MSTNRSKLDLLVRVRYSNTFPPPPYPPKLIDLSTNPLRYARPEFLSALSNETPLPMIVDAEMGMPLDLSHFDALWDHGADISTIAPSKDNLPVLDPEDEDLCADPASSGAGGAYSNGTHNGLSSHASGSGLVASSSASVAASAAAHVPWLRKTEYIARERAKPQQNLDELRNLDHQVDVSLAAQVRYIEQSFAANNDEFELDKLRHPTKPHLTAVESYEFLPDAEIWANKYDLYRFSERPGERPVDQDDPRLDTAILRPMEKDGDHFLAYFLASDDEAAFAFMDARSKALNGSTEDAQIQFKFIRDYETVKVEQDVANEFLLVLDDGQGDPSTPGWRPKGAYYKTIERKMNLKKRRVNPYEEPHQKLDLINLSLEPFTSEDIEEREAEAAEITDPYHTETVDAEGEVEADGDASMAADEPIKDLEMAAAEDARAEHAIDSDPVNVDED